jgi:nucleoside-diphosphate-sugar epimerase
LYVDDFTEAMERLIHCQAAVGEKINIGSNDEVEVLKLAEIIIEKMGISKPIDKHEAPEGSVKRRMPDITKIKTLTDWQPQTTLEDGLTKTVEYWMDQA